MKDHKPTKYSTSRTIPGQALRPADLLKRHLAGTLPDIDQSQKYEYHYNEDGEQIAVPLPLEMHELHNLAVALRKRQYEENLKAMQNKAKADRDKLIEEYKKTPEYQTALKAAIAGAQPTAGGEPGVQTPAP